MNLSLPPEYGAGSWARCHPIVSFERSGSSYNFFIDTMDTCKWYAYNIVLFPHQVFDKTLDNATLVLQIDNARLAADDFKVKYVEFFYLFQNWFNFLFGLG